MDEYRVEPVLGGYEAQQRILTIVGGHSVWVPLQETGYWADSSACLHGIVRVRCSVATRDEAERIIERAKAINAA